jgi:hypothetical protein
MRVQFPFFAAVFDGLSRRWLTDEEREDLHKKAIDNWIAGHEKERVESIRKKRAREKATNAQRKRRQRKRVARVSGVQSAGSTGDHRQQAQDHAQQADSLSVLDSEE